MTLDPSHRSKAEHCHSGICHHPVSIPDKLILFSVKDTEKNECQNKSQVSGQVNDPEDSFASLHFCEQLL